MLIKGNDVIGLKILSLKQGKQIDDVSDLVYDPQSHQVKALIVDKGGWFSDAKLILYKDVESIGKDAVMVKTTDVVRKASDISERVESIAKADNYLTKTKIVTESGTDLGTVSDIYFDDKTGRVEEFEVSQGIRNLQSGKKRVRVSDIVTIGEDATIVRAVAEAQFEKQAQDQGLQGMINKGKQTTTETINQAKATANSPETKDKIEQAKQKASEVYDKSKEQGKQLQQRATNKMNEVQNSKEAQQLKKTAQKGIKKSKKTVKKQTHKVERNIQK